MSAREDEAIDPKELGLEGGGFQRFLSPRSSYVLTRFVLLRWLGLVYSAAFLSTALQYRALIGPRGLLPAKMVVDTLLGEHSGSAVGAAREAPSLFLWTGASDAAIGAVAWTGVALSLLVFAGVTNAVVLVILWLLYLSIVNVGSVFYGYGWEIQLLETGLLAAFLCPVRDVRPFPASPPPAIPVWLFRWLIVRVMLGAGLIKLRGDACWRDLTCLRYHYETQPIPGPLSPYFHRLPNWVHTGGVLVNHLVEVLAPFGAFGPKWPRRVAGCAFVAFQLVLIVSGNLSFLNWLTIVPAIACFDDEDLARVLPRPLVEYARARTTRAGPTKPALWVAGGYAMVVGILSINPISNLVSSSQSMNRSFDPLHVVNTYGAFGSVERQRYEVIVQGSDADDPFEEEAYRDYELPCKPGPVDRKLCWITPYHRRLDWQMWFLPFGQADQNPWFIHFVTKILDGDPVIREQLAKDPFGGKPPRWVRAELYSYRYSEGRAVWEREHVLNYLRPVGRSDRALARYIAAYGFPRPDAPEPDPDPVIE